MKEGKRDWSLKAQQKIPLFPPPPYKDHFKKNKKTWDLFLLLLLLPLVDEADPFLLLSFL